MLSDSSIKQIAQLFCGDIEGCFIYKTWSQLISFFNSYFGFYEKYEQVFPSRWAFVYNKIASFLESGSFDNFLDIILSKDYLMKEQNWGMVEAISKSADICEKFKQIVHADQYITKDFISAGTMFVRLPLSR